MACGGGGVVCEEGWGRPQERAVKRQAERDRGAKPQRMKGPHRAQWVQVWERR